MLGGMGEKQNQVVCFQSPRCRPTWRMVKADPAIVNAWRNCAPLPDVKLDGLATFARTVVKNRGMVCGKTLSNYTNHIIGPPLDTAFQAEAWEEGSVQRQALRLSQ